MRPPTLFDRARAAGRARRRGRLEGRAKDRRTYAKAARKEIKKVLGESVDLDRLVLSMVPQHVTTPDHYWELFYVIIDGARFVVRYGLDDSHKEEVTIHYVRVNARGRRELATIKDLADLGEEILGD